MACIWLGIKYLKRTENDLTIRQWRKKKPTRPLWHIKSWRCDPQLNIYHKIHFNSADCELEDIMFSIHERHGHISDEQPKD